MGHDEFAKQMENVRDDSDRCPECGRILMCTTIEFNGKQFDTYYCDDSECANYKKTVREREVE